MCRRAFSETYFFLHSKELGNLRQRHLSNNIYHIDVVKAAVLGQAPPASEMAFGQGHRPLPCTPS